MNHTTYRRAAATIFSIVAVVHFMRLVFGWELILGGFPAPTWVSGLAILIAGIMAIMGFRKNADVKAEQKKF